MECGLIVVIVNPEVLSVWSVGCGYLSLFSMDKCTLI